MSAFIRKVLIPLNDVFQRKHLALSLNSSELGGSSLFRRSYDDERQIINEFHKQAKRLVVHARYLMNQNA